MTEWNEENSRMQVSGTPYSGDTSARVDAVRQIIAAGKNGGGEAASAQSAQHLARLLHDEEHAVRITAAHGLIGMRAHAVRPVIEALARDVQSARLRAAAHHVLLALYEQGCLNNAETVVLHALEGPDPEANTARALHGALNV